MAKEDWEAVRAIYLDGIATGQATFETTAPDWTTWNQNHLPSCRLVVRLGGQAIGWAASQSPSSIPISGGRPLIQ